MNAIYKRKEHNFNNESMRRNAFHFPINYRKNAMAT